MQTYLRLALSDIQKVAEQVLVVSVDVLSPLLVHKG